MKIKNFALLSSLLLLGGCKAPEKEPILTNYEIITIQPFYTLMKERCKDDTKIPFPDTVEYETDLLIEGATKLASSLPNVSYKEENNLKDKVINKETFEKFGENQIILFQTHGEYLDSYYLHETIVTGEDFISSEISEEDEERIVESGMFNQETFNMYSAITCDYVKAYCPDISGSIVYMGQCHGGHDWALATAFLDKGAIAVYGATDAIQMHYGDMMQYRITCLLGQINPETENYFTTGEALLQAQQEYGIDDSVLYEGGANGARMILYGDPNFRLLTK